MRTVEPLADLPGGALVTQGLIDLQTGRHTIPGCLVAIARNRFLRSGLLPASQMPELVDAELQLYRLLREEDGDAYSRYNALVRELVSFCQALEQRRTGTEGEGRMERVG